MVFNNTANNIENRQIPNSLSSKTFWGKFGLPTIQKHQSGNTFIAQLFFEMMSLVY